MSFRRAFTRLVVGTPFAILAPVLSQDSVSLSNPGFEDRLPDGAPCGWEVLRGLDSHGYGPPELRIRFDDVRPLVSTDGRGGSRCLAFPAEGVWFCSVFAHSDGDGRGVNGKKLGKAAVRQTVRLPAGRYRFTAWLRTADGDLYAGAFRLGYSFGEVAAYADDESTGIRWSPSPRAQRTSLLRGTGERGEWTRYRTEPFEVEADGPVTVWIRFDYTNENQFRARWQVDDAAIEPVASGVVATVARHAPCPPSPPRVRLRDFPGFDEPHLAGGRSTLEERGEVRRFRRARLVAPGDAIWYRFPAEPLESDRALDTLTLRISVAGRGRVEVDGARWRCGGPDPIRPVTQEWRLPGPSPQGGERVVTVRASASEPLRLYEIEAAAPSTTDARLTRVVLGGLRVPWCVGAWDASSGEFQGSTTRVADPEAASVKELSPSGRWEIEFRHSPVAGHRYFVVHGVLSGMGRIDVGADGLVEWIAETKGEEIVDLDVTELLRPGRNRVAVEADGGHDFAALVEACPSSSDAAPRRLEFGGDEKAELLTRVADSTWFWLRELHWEPSGLIDASVPRGHWYGQYWPVDLGFALREWLRWGYIEEAARTGGLVARQGWHGDSSNRSGGADNTGGNILVLQLCELLRRAEPSPEDAAAIWGRVTSHCGEVVAAADESPFGLLRGTNWENSGNRQRGPCYALSTTLGATASLRKAAQIARETRREADVDLWLETARKLRTTTLERLVLREDHRCPSGFVLPRETWAYGLRTDGSVEDEPLAGYFWAPGSLAEVDGLVAGDPPLFNVYDRTLAAALPVVRSGRRHLISGYAKSYDGPNATIVLAALLDRIDALRPLLDELVGETDVAEDRGSEVAELSRWAYGPPGGTEDTNLVCAAGFLWALRTLAGLDDLLASGGQLRIVPRLPWEWSELRVHDWPLRYRNGDGEAGWTTLSLHLRRDSASAALTIRTSKDFPGLRARLGPFPRGGAPRRVLVDGREVPSESQESGDAAWLWVTCSPRAGETVSLQTR